MKNDVPVVAILVDTATGWGRRIVRGVLDYAGQHGPWNLWIEPRGQDELFSLRTVPQVDGVVARVATPELCRELQERGVPVVNISGLQLAGATFPRVTADWRAAAELAFEHFRERGLTHFAYAGPLHLGHVQTHESAFEEVVKRQGQVCHIFASHEVSEDAKPGGMSYPTQEALQPWLRDLPKPVGIYTWAFQIGRDIVNACRRAGIEVPNDVAVLGGDFDELLSDACHPALSGVVIPARQIGRLAAETLAAMMRGEPAPRVPMALAPTEIEARLSTEVLAISDPQIRQAVAFLREHACEPIQVTDILRKVPMARRSLERRFRHFLGRTPGQEIQRLRIERARQLLAKTDLSMQAVAEACGYATYNYLGTIFKEQTGVSPRQYRQTAREG